jgi:hypothetical protein
MTRHQDSRSRVYLHLRGKNLKISKKGVDKRVHLPFCVLFSEEIGLGKVTIKNIMMDFDTRDENGMGIIAFVDLDNEAGLSFLLDSKADNPLFKAVMTNGTETPETDGECIYWQNGASLSIQEIFSIVQSEKSDGALI